VNLVYFTNYFTPHIGAASTYTRKIIDYLANQGHHILVFARGSQANNEKLKDQNIQSFNKNIRVIYSNPKIKHPYSTLLSHLENLYTAIRKEKYFNPNLILAQYHTFHFAPVMAALLAKKLKIPYVVRSHDIFSPYYGKLREIGTLPELVYLKLSNQITYQSIQFSDIFYVTATEQITHLKRDKKFKNTEFKWHPNGIDSNVFYPKEDNSLKAKYKADNIILYIGMLDVDLGIQQFIKSIPLINKEAKNTHFIIVGSGKDESLINDQINKLEINHKVHLIPPVNHSQIPYYINNCDFGMGFLAEDLFYKYCIPVKCLEYMACSKPFITTPVSRDVIFRNNTGIMINHINEKEISSGAIELLQDNVHRKTLGKNGFDIIQKKFLWDNLMKSFDKDIRNLI
jgi:glycosyltransferase involved in cell wall biosynthesis